MIRAGASNKRFMWVSMGPLGWMTVGLFVLLPWYMTKYTVLAMWWLFFYGPYVLVRTIRRRRQTAAPARPSPAPDWTHEQSANRANSIGPWPNVSRHAGPRDWSSHQ